MLRLYSKVADIFEDKDVDIKVHVDEYQNTTYIITLPRVLTMLEVSRILKSPYKVDRIGYENGKMVFELWEI
jgi:hypothetical protein